MQVEGGLLTQGLPQISPLEPLTRSSSQKSPQGRECDEPRHASWHYPFGLSRAWDRVPVHSSTRPMWKAWCKRQRSRGDRRVSAGWKKPEGNVNVALPGSRQHAS